ncbi:MAG: NAD-dependent epimerase/dehydratase family protein [Myxococcales bacterium]|nr:NAD-dependent epimerase/dehydratase family protein [Myxococcales bacterium]
MSGLTLVTGATGLLGHNLLRVLVARGRPVRALVRSQARAREVPAGVEIAIGDVTEPASLAAATAGCEVVHHTAGLPEQWLADPGVFDRVNAEGTANMVEAALAAGVRRFVHTSTIDVFVFPPPGGRYDESQIDPAPKATAYERSKQRADRIVADALETRGLPAVFSHPAALYGEGPATSPGTNQLLADLVRGKVPMLLPGGLPLVDVRDVAEGQVRAEERAEVGARYIFSERTMDLREIAAAVSAATGARIPPVMPLAIARAVAAVGEALSTLTRRPPLLPRGQLAFLQYGAIPVADRARAELEWTPRPFIGAGLEEALAFLRAAGRIP